jgi:hypothetical protein
VSALTNIVRRLMRSACEVAPLLQLQLWEYLSGCIGTLLLSLVTTLKAFYSSHGTCKEKGCMSSLDAEFMHKLYAANVQKPPDIYHSSFLPPTCMPPMLKSIFTFSPFFSPTFTSPLFNVHRATRPSLAILITLAQAIHHMLTLTLPNGARGKLRSHST